VSENQKAWLCIDIPHMLKAMPHNNTGTNIPSRGTAHTGMKEIHVRIASAAFDIGCFKKKKHVSKSSNILH